MKKMVLVVAVFVAALLAISIANAQFGSVKVPGVGSVSTDIGNTEYNLCKDKTQGLDNNIDVNSVNIRQKLDSMKEMKFVKCSKDYTKSDSKYDKENKVLDLEYSFLTSVSTTANCTKEKCRIYCSRK